MPVGGGVAVAERSAAPPAVTSGPRSPRARLSGLRTGSGRSPGGVGGRLRDFFSWRKMTAKRARRILYAVLGLMILGPFLAFVVGWLLFRVPTADDAAITQVATFTFADGATPVATVRPENINRVNVTLDRVPEHVRQAVLAAEDRSFYSNPGFDLSGIGRAVYNQLTGGVGGGSTITQQYIKVTTGQDDFSLWRKYREVVLAVKISRERTKDQILEDYLNTIYMGRGAYGVQAAAKAYFDKDVGGLTVSEAAMLAGVIQAPSNWDPAKNPGKAQERWNFVLNGMVESRWITPEERAQQVFPDNWLAEPPAGGGVPADDRYHIYERALAELNAQGITQDQVNTLGLTITTTIDQQRQIDAVDAVKEVMEGQPENLRTSLVSVDPRSGAILAYFGGADGLGLDYAGEAWRQPGSTFKPFVLAAALQSDEGVGLGTLYDGSSGQEFPGGVTVDNSEGFNCPGECTVKLAMTKSVNTVFYHMALDTGLQKVIDAANQAGIPTDKFEARGGIALGDQEVRPIDMAAAFGTFAADGVRHQPYLVSRVVAADGRVLFERTDPAGEQTIDPKVARNVTESMLDVADSSRIQLDGRPVAVKTGTVQLPGSRTGENKDAWTVGYVPQMSTAVWVGSDASDAIKDSQGRNVFGRLLPGAIWQAYMTDALEDVDEEPFSEFKAIGAAPRGEPGQRGGGDGGDAGDADDGGDDAGDGGDGGGDGGDGAGGGDGGGAGGGGGDGGGGAGG
ncbi:MAG TPA: transglycosylase domain-containing protein, partial [Pseudonocardia sp.]|nr:transglycosylase domain-containing protein [Pseudonocardia sp.]